MFFKLKLYFSIFFLAIFLFPAIVKEVHSIYHEEEFHCDARGSWHLHTQHHDCTLCDFVLPVISAPSSFQAFLSPVYFAQYIFLHKIEFYFSPTQFSSALLRAPPAIS